jgi:hypothetical protein
VITPSAIASVPMNGRMHVIVAPTSDKAVPSALGVKTGDRSAP